MTNDISRKTPISHGTQAFLDERSEEHTSELQSHSDLVCRLLLEKKSIFEPPPFHNTLHYQEVLATLRYGIIARKGLIVLIGDAGIGKSTLLDQLTRELETHVACI